MTLVRKVVDTLDAFGLMKVRRCMPVQRSVEPCGQKNCQHDDCEQLAPPFSHGAQR